MPPPPPENPSSPDSEPSMDCADLFEDLASDRSLRAAFMRAPLHLPGRAPQLANSFTLEKDIQPMAMRGVLNGKVVSVLSAKASNGSTWNAQNEYIRDATHLRERLRAATLYMNQAGAAFPKVAEICTHAQRAFGMPANVNVYLAAGGGKGKRPRAGAEFGGGGSGEGRACAAAQRQAGRLRTADAGQETMARLRAASAPRHPAGRDVGVQPRQGGQRAHGGRVRQRRRACARRGPRARRRPLCPRHVAARHRGR